MKGLMVFSSLMSGMFFSIWMATSEANTMPVMESHGSLKISASSETTTKNLPPVINTTTRMDNQPNYTQESYRGSKHKDHDSEEDQDD